MAGDDDKDFRAYPVGDVNYVYGHDVNGVPVKQLAGAVGKGDDAKLVAGVGAVFLGIVSVSQAQYDALAVKDPNIFYVIPEA